MSIGKVTRGYTLVSRSTGTVYNFDFGNMLIRDNDIRYTSLGTDLTEWFIDTFGWNTSHNFYFNGLSGAYFDIRSDNRYDEEVYITFYIRDSTAGDNESRWEVHGTPSGGHTQSTSAWNIGVGLFLGQMPNNELYEGMSVYPFHFAGRLNGDNIRKGGFPFYGREKCAGYGAETIQLYRDGQYTLTTEGYVGAIYTVDKLAQGNLSAPNNLLKNYHNLSFPDSGDIKKQNELVVNGFPFGSDDEGESKDVGGQGEMKDTSTPIEIDDPRLLFVGNLFRVYKLNTTALSALSNYLLSSEFLDNVVKLFNDPMDYLISLTAIPTAAFSGSSENIKIGNVETNIGATRLSNFFVDIDCGSVNIPLYFDAFLDCAPYTSISLYLVGVGTVDLNVDMFLGQSVKLKYRVDALTGQCLVFVSNNDGLVATYSGNIAYHIPLRSKDYSEFFSGVMSTAASAMSGNALGVGAGALQLAQGVTKPRIVQGGTFGGNTSIMLNKKCYLIIERPSISIPKTYPSTIGYMSRISAQLSTLKGFTQVEAIHLEHVTATDEEKVELEALLKTGVIL